MNQTPCNWPIEYGQCAPPADTDEATLKAVEDMAVELLWAWTGRRFGLCEASVRPCHAARVPEGSTYWGTLGAGSLRGWAPILFDGQWFNIPCGSCSLSCGCADDDMRTLRLPGRVEAVTSVWIDGEQLDPAAYLLRDQVLRRIDGKTWPLSNDEFGDPRVAGSGAWEIAYTRGTPVSSSGSMAAGVLASELLKAVCRDKGCQLPQRVQSVTRQGVSIGAVLDSFEDLQDGRTGIWLIDAWVAQVNAPQVAPSQVFSPDLLRGAGRGTRAGLARGW